MAGAYTAVPMTASSNNDLISRHHSLPSSSDDDDDSNLKRYGDISNGTDPARFVSRKTRYRRSIVIVGLSVLLSIVLISLFGVKKHAAVGRRCTTCVIDVKGLQLPLRHDLTWPEAVRKPSAEIGNVRSLNRTLGFERIYVLNMPNRRDKKAELTLLAYQYDLDLIFVDGVDGRLSRPDIAFSREGQGQYGAAEGHASVWRRMLEDGVQTALILEDDVDFSIDVKNQLLRLQEPLGMLLSLISGKPTYRSADDPYNSAHWDQLWLGMETERPWMQQIITTNTTQMPFVAYRDPTRSELHDVYHEQEYMQILDAYNLPQYNEDADKAKRLRVVQPSVEPFALSGYALTAKGARKVLYKNAHKSWIDHIDFDMKEMGRVGQSRQFSVVPPLFQQRKPLDGEDSERMGAHSTTVIAGKLGRTSTMQDTAREHLYDDLLAENRPLFVQKGG